MKKCTKCGELKVLTEYSKQKACKDGYAYMCKKCFKEYRSNNKDSISSKSKLYYQNNRDKLRAATKRYVYNNQDIVREYNRKYQREYHLSNFEVKRWRDLLTNTLKRLSTAKSNSTHKLLGYSAEDLREHLNALGMDWEHHQIDHKIPVSWFKEDTPPSIVNDLRNLQPSSVETNTSKGSRYMDEVSEDYAKEVLQHIKEDYLNFF